MKILPEKFTKNGFTLTQVVRDGKFAIYERTKAGREHFEVVIISSHNGFHVTDPETGQKSFIEPAETYPGANQWGTYGWTFLEKEQAWSKFRALVGTSREGR